MLGKSVGPREGLAGLLITLATTMLIACAHNVPQDKRTGSDGKTKGARAMTLENGEARASGIVTYPGGDRVDWKVIELPEKKKGSLEIKLTWTPPRPGLQLAFDVFDEWNNIVKSSATKSKKRSRGRTRSIKLDTAKGKYFIRVYAVNRGDAGKYKLTADFKEVDEIIWDPTKLDIPDPPKLAAVPEHVEPCDDTNFDPKKPECKLYCPAIGAPPNWPACAGKCPTPPSIEIEACWDKMPCPNPPDRRVKKCTKEKFPRCPDIKNPDPNNPNCDNAKAEPVKARVLKPEVAGNEVTITIATGSDAGVAKGWKGQVLRGDSESPLSGGDFVVFRVDKKVSVGKVRLTVDQINANPWVRLSPP